MSGFPLKLAWFSLALSLGGCGRARYTPEAGFVDLYAKLKLASVAASQEPSRANEAQRAILAQHGMTPAEFHDHFVRLANHPEAWKPFQEGVISRMQAFQSGKTGEFNGR